jgi:hypothetical protein
MTLKRSKSDNILKNMRLDAAEEQCHREDKKRMLEILQEEEMSEGLIFAQSQILKSPFACYSMSRSGIGCMMGCQTSHTRKSLYANCVTNC